MAVALQEKSETSKGSGPLHDPYLWHKLHSASGIFPIGFFLLQHLIANSYALRGAGAYNDVIKVYGGLPFVVVLEIVVIYLPILYHSIYGIWITAYGQPNLSKYQYGRNWMYFLQRVSGVIAFFYIGYHVWNTSLQKYVLLWHHNPHPEQAIQYHAMSLQMADPLHFWIQAIGIVATVFHFTNGLWNFCIRWGITISAHSQRLNQYVCWGLFFIFAGMGLWSIAHLRADGLRGTDTPSPAINIIHH
jgi:succinate dehydrogenase / fumarate reductase cytochrome b subunit